MNIWAIADIHLCLSCPDKTMEDFGHRWENYIERIKKNWIECVAENDLVLIAGDISWAMKLDQAQKDLEFIDKLPGTKVMIKGNHDYWWSSINKIRKSLPSTIHAIQNDAIHYEDVSIAGARLWDCDEFDFDHLIEYVDTHKVHLNPKTLCDEENQKIFDRELIRLENSLKALKQDCSSKIVMTHYPPIGLELKPSKVHHLLKKYHVDTCVFGHVHNIKEEYSSIYGEFDGIEYVFVAADYLHFKPVKIR